MRFGLNAPHRGPRSFFHIALFLRPRQASLLVAVACVGAAVAYALSQQTPVGRVDGQAVLSDTQSPIGRAQITLFPKGDDQDTRPVRATRSDERGHFIITNVAVGDYYAVAETPAHAAKRVELMVVEGETAPLMLALDRSYPELDVGEHPRTFLTSETLRLPVRGYVNGSRPAGTDLVHVRLFRAQPSSMVVRPAVENALEKLARTSGHSPSELRDVLSPPPGSAASCAECPPGAPVAQLVLERDVPITEGDSEGFFTKDLTFNSPGTGLYLMEATHADNHVVAWAVVTDTALVVKRVRRQFVAYTTDMRSGRALPGSRVVVYGDGRPVAMGTTNPGGFLDLTLPDTMQKDATIVTLAAREADETFTGGVEDEFEESGQFAVYLYTDRPLYRPGQRIYYKGIIRRAIDPGVTYAVPEEGPVTVELRDPNGAEVLRESRQTNALGSISGSADLSPEAPTGTYTLIATVRGEQHTQDVQVAAYRKPEFAVSVTPAKPRYVRGETVELRVSSDFYFGAPVAGAKVEYSVFRSPDWASAYPDTYGYDPEDDNGPGAGYGDTYGETVIEGVTRLDERGEAVLRFRADAPDDPDAPPESILTASVSVTDESGRSAYGEGTIRVTPGDFRLTVSPLGYVGTPGQAETVVVTARDFDRRPLRGVPVDLEAGYLRWDSSRRTLVYGRTGAQHAVTGVDGTATVTLTPARAGELRITATAHDPRGRVIHAQTWLWVTDDRGGDLGTEYNGLSLLTDQHRYRPGQTARVLLNTDDVGETVYLSVEGDRLYRTIAVPVTQHSTVVRVPVPAAYAPNVDLVASYVRNKKLVESSIPLRVSVPERDLSISIRSDRSTYQPGDPITYDVQATDAGGHPVRAELSFGVVDESIYALAEDDPTALSEAFYPRRSDAVQTHTSFAVEYLGDTNKGEVEIATRKLFPDTAYWAPVVQTDDQGRATVRFTLPDSLTTWRATAVGHTAATVLGRGTQRVTVAKPFFVLVEPPRFLTQGDRARILALVHNQTGAAQTAEVRLQADGLRTEGPDTHAVAVRPGQIGEVSWQVTAAGIAPATIRVTARTTGGGQQTHYTDGVELPLAVRPHGREQLDGATGELLGTHPSTATLRLDPAAIPSASELTIRITPSVSTALVGALEYLVGYPYGCTEQTMSRFYPDVLVQRVLKIGGAHSQPFQADLPGMVRDSLARLYRFQHDSGAWGWWEYDEDSAWMTAYALVGLATAAEEGYPVNPEVVQHARAAAPKLAATATQEDRAFLAYALALVGDTESARAERQRLDLQHLGPQGLAYAALLDKRLGGDGRAALAALMAQARAEDGTLSWAAARGEASWDWDARMTTASALRAMLAVDPTDPRINAVVRWLMLGRTGADWESTRDTAWVLAALADYLRIHPENAAPSGDVRIGLNGRALQTIRLTEDVAREQEIAVRVPGAALQPGTNAVTLGRAGGASAIFYSVQLRQTVAMDPIPPLEPASGGVAIRREYLRVVPRKTGVDAWSLQTESTGNVLRTGDQIRVRLTITVPEDLAYVIIEDPFPAGAEVTERGSADEVPEWSYWWSSVDVRDDRIAFFARTLRRGTHVLEYNLRPLTPGRYHALPTLVQEMYVPAMRSESAETQVDVR